LTVFVDTSAIYALLDSVDENHSAARDTYASLIRHEPLLTHSYVAVESAALVQRRLGAEAVRRVFDDLLAPLELIWIDEPVHHRAVAAMIASESSTVSLVDWTSFEVMRDQGIDRAFAFDDDFERQGFELVV
jgi:predicted nucleic acid-binding protein